MHRCNHLVTARDDAATVREPGTETVMRTRPDRDPGRRPPRCRRCRKRGGVALALLAVVVSQGTGLAGQEAASTGLRVRLEGTWVLEEWHRDGEVLRPPQVGGRWSNHDGVVLATFFRQSHGSFESFAGYGTYAMDDSNWSYAYDRVQTARGASPEDAVVTVRENTPRRRFTIEREGELLVLEAEGDRREYDDTFFTYLVDGEVLRRYRKVRDPGEGAGP